MKKLVAVVLCCVAFPASLLAQTSSAPLLKQMAKETCQEMSKTDFTNKSPDELKIALGIPLVAVIARHQAELKDLGYNFGDPKTAEKLGNDVGFQLVAECPQFMTAIVKSPDSFSQLAKSGKDAAGGSISGTLIKIVGGDFSYLQVEDSRGKVEKLWWMEYFDGSTRLITEPQKYLNKPIRIRYVEKEIFNSTLNDYVKIKVITGME